TIVMTGAVRESPSWRRALALRIHAMPARDRRKDLLFQVHCFEACATGIHTMWTGRKAFQIPQINEQSLVAATQTVTRRLLAFQRGRKASLDVLQRWWPEQQVILPGFQCPVSGTRRDERNDRRPARES